ncbi:MAG: histidine phosphatase family protein [Gaiellaceae bacterium]
MTRLILVRHGETEWNAKQQFQGHADPGLNELGRRQAQDLAESLALMQIDAIYSSDLKRARETAETIGERVGLRVHEMSELREVDVGEWTGLTHEEIEELYPGALHRWRSGTGDGWELGESYERLTARLLRAFRVIADRHPNDRVLIVGHGGTIRAMLAHVSGVSVAESRKQTPPIGNCEIYLLTVNDGTVGGDGLGA